MLKLSRFHGPCVFMSLFYSIFVVTLFMSSFFHLISWVCYCCDSFSHVQADRFPMMCIWCFVLCFQHVEVVLFSWHFHTFHVVFWSLCAQLSRGMRKWFDLDYLRFNWSHHRQAYRWRSSLMRFHWLPIKFPASWESLPFCFPPVCLAPLCSSVILSSCSKSCSFGYVFKVLPQIPLGSQHLAHLVPNNRSCVFICLFNFPIMVQVLGIEPRAFRMRSGCDTTTPCAPC